MGTGTQTQRTTTVENAPIAQLVVYPSIQVRFITRGRSGSSLMSSNTTAPSTERASALVTLPANAKTAIPVLSVALIGHVEGRWRRPT